MSSNVSSAECLTFGFIRESFQHVDNWDIIPMDVIGNQFGKEINSLNGIVAINVNQRKKLKFQVFNPTLNAENDGSDHDQFEENKDNEEEEEQDEEEDEILYWDSDDVEQENQDNKGEEDNDSEILSPRSIDATLNEDWNTIKSGYCYTSKIDLPSFIINKYNELKEFKNDYKNCDLCGIFKCGGRYSKNFNRTTSVSAIVFKSNDINWRRRQGNNDDDIIKAYNISLPDIPIPATAECIYSNYYGLFNMYDGKKHIYRLPFGEVGGFGGTDPEETWKWLKMSDMKYTHYKGALCIINIGDNRYDEKLFVCGGYSSDGNKCELLDIYNNKWINLPNLEYRVSQNGIKYDDGIKNRIYIGGGSRTYSKQKNASSMSSYFDILNQKWYKLPNTIYEHAHHPLLYLNMSQPMILNICGNDQHDIGHNEYLDLREFKGKWKELTENDQLYGYFDIPKDALIKRICA